MSQTHHLPALASADLLIAFGAYERAVLGLSEQTVRNHRTELVRAGVDIHVVQRLLGHTHIASTVARASGHRRPARRGRQPLGRGLSQTS